MADVDPVPRRRRRDHLRRVAHPELPRRAEVAVVLPYGSRVATSRINFRLLARDALTHEKRLSIVAGDAATRALAASAGLPVFSTVGEYEGSAEGDGGASGAASPLAPGPSGAPLLWMRPSRPGRVPWTTAAWRDRPRRLPRPPRWPGGRCCRRSARALARTRSSRIGGRHRRDDGRRRRTGRGRSGRDATGRPRSTVDSRHCDGRRRRARRRRAGAAAHGAASAAAVGSVVRPERVAAPAFSVPRTPDPRRPGRGRPGHRHRRGRRLPAPALGDRRHQPERGDHRSGRVPGRSPMPTRRTPMWRPASCPRPSSTSRSRSPTRSLRPASGSRRRPAKGTVRFDNLDFTSANTIAKGAVVSTGSGVRFRTDRAVTVPPAELVGLTVVPVAGVGQGHGRR